MGSWYLQCRKYGSGQGSGWRRRNFSQKVPTKAGREDTILPSREKMGSCAVGRFCLSVIRASLSFIWILQGEDLTLCPRKLREAALWLSSPLHLFTEDLWFPLGRLNCPPICSSFLVTECPHDFQRQQSAGGKRGNRVPRERSGMTCFHTF